MAGGGSGAGQQAGKGRQMGWLRHVLTVLSVFIFVSFTCKFLVGEEDVLSIFIFVNFTFDSSS